MGLFFSQKEGGNEEKSLALGVPHRKGGSAKKVVFVQTAIMVVMIDDDDAYNTIQSPTPPFYNPFLFSLSLSPP